MGSHGSNVFFKKPPFIFDDYQTYLSDLVEVHHGIRGLRSRLAESANCQPSYLTQVLKHEAHFSLDQLFGIATYFKLTKPEWEYLREL